MTFHHTISRPCGHSYLIDCECVRQVAHFHVTTTGAVDYNGLCECRGPLNRHPFHSKPLPAEYVGKHRAP